MSTVLLRRPPREEVPAPEPEIVTLSDPPQPLERQSGGQGAVQVLFPVLGTAGSMIYILANPRPVAIAAGLVFMVAAIGVGAGLFFVQRGQPRRRLREDRERYLAYLEQVRDQMRDARKRQVAAEAYRHPEPDALLDLCGNRARLWERRTEHADFLRIRLGRGETEPLLQVDRRGADTPLDRADPVCASAAAALVEGQRVLADQPIALDLTSAGIVTVCGDLSGGRALVRAVLAQIATLHAAEDVRMAFCFAPETLDDWSWVKWLPHTLSEHTVDGPVRARLVASDTGELNEILRPELESRLDEAARSRATGEPLRKRMIVVIDAARMPSHLGFDLGDPGVRPEQVGVTLVYLVGKRRLEPSVVDVRLTVETGEVLVENLQRGDQRAVRGDALSVAEADAIARAVTPIRLSEEEDESSLVASIELPDLLGVPDVGSLDPALAWRRRSSRDLLRVPIGLASNGLPLMLDLKESALGGMGPHGLVVGATGSGKSELLRTLVTALAATHDPDLLAFVLVDYKGGATFDGLGPLPHVSGVITNLQDDLGLVDRMHDALFGELRRRQRILRDAGNLPNVHEYNRRRDADPSMPPLPSLLVIVDEFSELLTAKPDFAELFVAIGRIGRSIGVHLLLSSQRLETGRIRGLESHLSYRIGLKTLSPAESREAVGVPDAYELPPIPGSAFLRVDTTVFERFKAALVSAPYRPAQLTPDAAPGVLPFTAYNGLAGLVAPHPRHASGSGLGDDAMGMDTPHDGPTVMDVVVQQLSGVGRRAHQVWLPPLAAEFDLASVLGSLEHDEERGLSATGHRQGDLTIPIGLLDRPQQQRVDVLSVDLADADGNLGIVGAPQSGKSTALRTLVLSAALTHTPRELSFYALDFGGALVPLEALPHVGGVAGRSEPERATRILGEFAGLLAVRENLFREHRIDSAPTFRRQFRAGETRGQAAADCVLLLDNWGAIRTEIPDAEEVVTDIAMRGQAYGMHVIVTASRWTEIRPALQNALRGRLELRINDPFESRVDRKAQDRITDAPPARGVTTEKLVFQVALPRVDGVARVDDLGDALDEAVAQVARGWTGQSAPSVRVLPSLVTVSDLPGLELQREPGVPMGISGVDLQPVLVDLFGLEPHLLILGDAQSGRTAALRLLLQGLMARYSPGELLIALFDYRRTLLDVVPQEYLLSYVGSSGGAEDVVADVSRALKDRLPGPDISTRQLRERSWWQGPEVVVVADDYDLVSTRSQSPLDPLADLVPQARDLGLHLVLARRTAGVSRAAYEPVLQSLVESGSPGLLLSGDRAEGPLVNGVAARQQPPGRALLARRGRPPEPVQLAWSEPVE